MATPTPAFSTQERAALKCLRAIAGGLDFHRARCAGLERQLATLAESPRRASVLRDLLEARQREQAAIRDLRDGAVYVTDIVPPLR